MVELTLGLSPCPNDTFIFYALLHGLIKLPDQIKLVPRFADVEKLNKFAMESKLAVSKISLGVVPQIMGKYVLLNSGAALGWGCGPKIVAKNDEFNPYTASIAIPGKHTTANLLLDLNGNYKGERVEMLFSEIIPAVAEGKVELGVIIHEGRFTFVNMQLIEILDLGEWWEQTYHLPLPLGAIAVRRDVPISIANAIQKAISQSVGYAFKHPRKPLDFVKSHAQELDEAVIKAHIDTFVTSYSENLGSQGEKAIEVLIEAALHQKESASNLFLAAE